MKYIDETTSTSAINVTLIAEETIKPITIAVETARRGTRRGAGTGQFLQGFVNFINLLICWCFRS